MQFGYECQKCGKRFDSDFPIGKAPRVAPCPHCSGQGRRVYEGMSISVKVDGHFARSSTFGEQMKARNAAAGERMKGRMAPKLLGYQHSDGRVAEA